MEHDQSPTEGGGRSEDPPTGKRVGESAEDKTKVTVIQIVPSHNRHPNANQQEKTHRYLYLKTNYWFITLGKGSLLTDQAKNKLIYKEAVFGCDIFQKSTNGYFLI